MGALAADRQALTVAQATVGRQVHEALDVDRDLAAQIALHSVVLVDRFADLKDFLVGQGVDAARGLDAHLAHDFARLGLANAVDVLERDHDALVSRNVDACYAGHVGISPGSRAKTRKRPRPSGVCRMGPAHLSRLFAEAPRYREENFRVNALGSPR
jgi:hypothetical protein